MNVRKLDIEQQDNDAILKNIPPDRWRQPFDSRVAELSDSVE